MNMGLGKIDSAWKVQRTKVLESYRTPGSGTRTARVAWIGVAGA